MRYVIGLMAVIWCALAAPGQAQTDKRVALVIGNAAYGHHGGLPNVPNDAAAMAALFKTASFDSIDVPVAARRLGRGFHSETVLISPWSKPSAAWHSPASRLSAPTNAFMGASPDRGGLLTNGRRVRQP
jgi:hypothetical protein